MIGTFQLKAVSVTRLISVRHLFTTLFLLLFASSINAQSFTFEKSRPAKLSLSQYKQVAIGTFYGPDGTVTEKSLDLADALTSILFNAKTFEVIDRNALVTLAGSQKNSDVKVIDETTIKQLNKKLQSAFLITGRIQSDRVEQKLIETKNGTCAGNYSFYWQVTGEVSVQVKIFDVATGKLIYSDPVKALINVKSKENCERTEKFNLETFKAEALKILPENVSKLIVQHNQKMQITFKGPDLILLKNPFKNLNQAANFFVLKEYPKAMEILEAYAKDEKLKSNLKPKAYYNYALGLYCVGDYTKAKQELTKAMQLDTLNGDCAVLYKQIEEEEALNQKAAKK